MDYFPPHASAVFAYRSIGANAHAPRLTSSGARGNERGPFRRPWYVGKFSLNPARKADGGTAVLIAQQCNHRGCGCGMLPHVNPYHTHRLDDTPAVQRRADTCASCAPTVVYQEHDGLACSGETPGRRWGGVFPTRYAAKQDGINMPKPSATALFTAVSPYLVK